MPGFILNARVKRCYCSSDLEKNLLSSIVLTGQGLCQNTMRDATDSLTIGVGGERWVNSALVMW